MGKKVEVSYNPQLGYLQTIFHHNFDFLTGIKSYTERTDGVEFVVDTYKENTVKVFIQCVGETAFRFRMYTPGNEHPFDNSIYQLEGQNGVNITENEEFISISKGKIEARVRKYPWEVSYYLDGKLKTKEQIKDSNVDNMCKNLPVGFTYDENKEIIGVNETMYLYADEEFYGFGEKFTDFGKRGQTINCWQTDALSTNTEKSYKNHPFFMSSRGYAILLNTYTRSKFEMGSFSNVAYNMSVEDKVLDYVIWMGNDYKALLKSYINQTGKIPMIPKWALGLWMSKCSYQTQDEIYEVVKISKERDIKIDVIHIDGWQKEGDAGAWVWDYERFPNPEEMIYKLKKEGIHLCLWIFPYIDENSKYFKEAEEKGFLVKNTKGVTSRFYSTATSTSKVGCFDFTNPHFIEWYKPKVMPLPGAEMATTAQIYAKNGVTGEVIRGEKVKGDGEWHALSLEIPGGQTGHISEVGIILCGVAKGFAMGDVAAYIDDLYIDGNPDYRLDFGRMKLDSWHVTHQEVPQFAKLKGHSYLGGQYLSLSCADFAEMYTGHHLWNNYRVTAVLKPVTGTEHFVNIRVQGAMRSYAAGFSKNNKLVLRKNYYGYTTLCETDFEWKVDEEYKISLTADGSTISVSVNDKEYLKFTDSDLPLLTGCAGISVEKGSHCLYRDIAITGRE